MREESSTEEIKRPSLVLSLSEGIRAFFELGSYVPYRLLKKNESEGDGHPVLILPGFMASDFSTIPLRSFIHKLGYKVYGWGEGRNYANVDYVGLLIEKLERIYQRHQEPITIIGWSLGGIYARQLGKYDEEIVRQIITMGSPFKGLDYSNNAIWMYDLLKRSRIISEDNLDEELLEDIPVPANVPTTAIFTKEDGVVPWELCLEEEDEWHQNVQVRGSHFGLGVNPLVLQIVADRLLCTKSTWTYFETSNLIEDIFVKAQANKNMN